MPLVPAYAIGTAPGMWSAWGYDGSTDTGGEAAGDFVIAGGLNKGGPHGTYDDEWALVGVIGIKIVEHGGYFCPYQLQCANERGEKKTWTMYYWPNGFSYGKCEWLCEDGHSGTNCMPNTSSPVMCDNTKYTTETGGKFSGISLKTSGKDSNQREADVTGFNAWGKDPECDVVLGVIKFLEHGVIAAPVRVCCGRDNWRGVDSYISSVYRATGVQKVLCAPGYESNTDGSDCKPINEDLCSTQNMKFCANFPREQYDSSIHRLEKNDAGCVKYFCSEPGTAFPSVGDTRCIECSTGVKGGANSANGVCVECQTGEYFDQESSSCKIATAYSKSDMLYGKGKTKNTTELEEQCWTIVDPTEYVNCVKGVVPESDTE